MNPTPGPMLAARLADLERENADLRRLLRRAAGVLRDVERTQDVASACLRGLEEAMAAAPIQPSTLELEAALTPNDGVESQRAFDARIAALLEAPANVSDEKALAATLPPRVVPSDITEAVEGIGDAEHERLVPRYDAERERLKP